MDIEKLNKLKEEPHLSGAYIRSLVKQLTSSRSKDPMNPKALDSVSGDGFNQSLTNVREGFSETPQSNQTPKPQQPKKQVRRRLHTSRPYQERLLNMAEARREIVTALKFHRASMKQANDQQQQQQSQPLPQVQPSLEQEENMKSRRNPRLYPSKTTNFCNFLENISYSSFSYPPPNPFTWASSPIAPLPITDNLNLTLPNQTLGLNLNFHDFNNLDTTLYHNNHHPSIYSFSSPSSSSSPALSSTEEVPSVVISPEVAPMMDSVMESGVTAGGLHPAMDDEEMAEIRSIGEQHQMEWNDTLNLVTSAWWFKFLKTMEIGPEERGEEDGYHLFDEVMEFPAWLNANESCFLQQHMDEYCSEDYLQDPALPCMDIGEIEGIDGDCSSSFLFDNEGIEVE
ncbi:hypothetical protein HHK36_021914 [Tetracentron sinense]|uniref:Uncharacterized protein n=1 Tax=Tetracentron sinense TaxID=13715 RepID=A0A834YW35_TETSI|nr:hypothetical protein HHK36_021914 [Tetracentron sinense]